MAKHVYTISPLYSFADTLAEMLIAKNGGNPLKLAQTLILLPTRRACLTLNKAFLQKAGGKPVLLPRILPFTALGDEDAGFFFQGVSDEKLPKAVNPLERALLLTRLIMRRSQEDMPADKAFLLAKDLSVFLDEKTQYGVTTRMLEQIVPDNFATHWQEVLSFLKIVTENWPLILKERNLIDSAERQVRLFQSLATAWQTNPPPFPVVAAGSTGSLPTTALLLDTVASLENGCVILPGLNKSLSETERMHIRETHPQYHLMRLLDSMKITPDDVIELTGNGKTASSERFRLINEALKPFETTDEWYKTKPFSAEAADGVTRLDCADEAQEALCISLILRNVLETPEKTAAVITPDRNLAKRVIACMRRYGVTVDDSAGEPLGATPLGTFLNLSAQAAADGMAPYSLLALLKHPLTTLGLTQAAARRKATLLDKVVLRGMQTGKGLKYLKDKTAQIAELSDFVNALDTAAGEFTALMTQKQPHCFGDFLNAHLKAAEHLAASADKAGAARLWTGNAGEAATDLFAGLFDYADVLGKITAAQYLALLNVFLRSAPVRLKYGMHPRIDILGTMEARLVRPDVLILASLNEGKWPQSAETDAWFSRPMRQACGLPLPEHLTGLAAHDFAQSFCAPTVFLTRALKEDGTPTVASRWLLRTETLLKMSGISFNRGDWNAWAEKLDAPEKNIIFPPPAPKPPVESRPRRLSVTKIETLMRDPYAVYARHILNLEPLEDIDAPVSAADFGTMLHAVLKTFVEKNQQTLADGARNDLFETALLEFKKLPFSKADALFFEQRLKRALDWFYATYAQKISEIRQSFCERKGEISFSAKGGTFTLTGIADRIDVLKDGSADVIDYKTGYAPTPKEVAAGYAPQLPLEADMLEKGAFADIGQRKARALEYWMTKGDSEGGSLKTIPNDGISEILFDNLTKLINAFDDADKAYDATPDVSKKPRYNDYDHLARFKEWSTAQQSEENDDNA